MTGALDHVRDLGDLVVASPSPFHAAAELERRLVAAGLTRRDEADAWAAGSGFVVRDGGVVAWRVPDGAGPATPFRVVGAHTDSPGFVLKPRPDLATAGWAQIGTEVYGGPLLNSWLDRELGLAGRLVLASGEQRLVRTGAVMRIPQLAIHLDRTVNEKGVKLDKQAHTTPVWGLDGRGFGVVDHLARTAGTAVDDVVGLDVVAFDTARPQVFGPDDEFFASGRLDNLTGVHAGLTALLDAPLTDAVLVLAAFDHEEVGSETRSGAAGPFLADVLDRISLALGAGPDERHRAYARSICLSVDAGHAVHPNYAGRHDPAHHPLLGGGPLLKINANQRYATDGVGAAAWRRACRSVDVPVQEFVSNNDIPCGSTIGPITATRLGIRTVDVGQPLLSMHSAREMAGTADALMLARAATAFLAGA